MTQDALAFEESRGGDGEEQVRCEPRRRRKRQRLKRSKRTVMRLRAQKKKTGRGIDPFTSASEVNHQQFHRFRERYLGRQVFSVSPFRLKMK